MPPTPLPPSLPLCLGALLLPVSLYHPLAAQEPLVVCVVFLKHNAWVPLYSCLTSHAHVILWPSSIHLLGLHTYLNLANLGQE